MYDMMHGKETGLPQHSVLNQNKTLRHGGFFGYSGLFPSVIPLLRHHNLIVPLKGGPVNFFFLSGMLCS